MPRWFYKRDGQEYGPLTELGMRELIARGRLSEASSVRRYDDHDPDHEHPWEELKDSALTQRLELDPVTEHEPIQVPMPEYERPAQMPFLVRAACLALSVWCALQCIYCALLVPEKLRHMMAGEFHDQLLLTGFGHWMASWGVGLLVLHLLLVMAWQAASSEVAPLYGAELTAHSPSSALFWVVPGLNIYQARGAIIELWCLAKDPRAWSRGGLRSTPWINAWWLTLVAAACAATAQIMIRRNTGKALLDGRMEHWQGPLSLISATRDALWALHLALFMVLIWKIYKQQATSLRTPPKRRGKRE